MENPKSGIFRSKGIPAFRIASPPDDSDLSGGVRFDNPLFFMFKTMCKLNYQYVDERGVIHTQNNGIPLMTDSKWRIRWNLQFEWLASTGSVGGNPRPMEDITTYHGEFEFLMYLKNNLSAFSGNGSSDLQFILDFDDSFDIDDTRGWNAAGQEQAFDVCIMAITPGEFAATTHTMNVILITKNLYDKLPYTWTPNRDMVL